MSPVDCGRPRRGLRSSSSHCKSSYDDVDGDDEASDNEGLTLRPTTE